MIMTTGPLPPRPLSDTVGIVGPWREEPLSVSRHTADGRPVVTVSIINEQAARFNLRAAMDLEVVRAGWVLYEDAPAWLREMYDIAWRQTR